MTDIADIDAWLNSTEPKFPPIAAGPDFNLDISQAPAPETNVSLDSNKPVKQEIQAGAPLTGLEFKSDANTEEIDRWLNETQGADIKAKQQRAAPLIEYYKNGGDLPDAWVNQLAQDARGGVSAGQIMGDTAAGIKEGVLDAAGHPVEKILKPAWQTFGAMPLKALQESTQGPASDAALAYGAAKGVMDLGKLASGVVGFGSGLASDPVEAYKRDLDRQHDISKAEQFTKNAVTQYWADPEQAPASQSLGEFIGQAGPIGAAGKPAFSLLERGIGNASKFLVEKAAPTAIGRSIQGVAQSAPWVASGATALAGHPWGAAGILMARYWPEARLPVTLARWKHALVEMPAEALDDFGSKIAGASGADNVMASFRQATKDEADRFTRVGQKLRQQYAGKIPNVDDTDFSLDQLTKPEQQIREIDNRVKDLNDKYQSMRKWETFNQYINNATQTGLNIAGLTTIPSTAFAGLTSLAAQPINAEETAKEATEQGLGVMAPFSLFGARSARLMAVGDSLARAGRARTEFDAAHGAGMENLSPEQRRQIDIANGVFGKTGRTLSVYNDNDYAKVLEQGGKTVERDADGNPINLTAGFVDNLGNGYVRASRVGYAGHELTHMVDHMAGNLATEAYKGTMEAIKSPDSPLLKAVRDFYDTYMERAKKSDPTMGNLTPDALMSEGAAELGRYILQSMPLEQFYGGGTIIDALKQKIGRITDRLRKGDEIKITPALNAPFTQAQVRDVINAFYKAGSRLQRGEVAEVPETGQSVPVDEPVGARDDLRKGLRLVGVTGNDAEDAISQAFKHAAEKGENGNSPNLFTYAARIAKGLPPDITDPEVNQSVTNKIAAGQPVDKAVKEAAQEQAQPTTPPPFRGVVGKYKLMPEPEEDFHLGREIGARMRNYAMTSKLENEFQRRADEFLKTPEVQKLLTERRSQFDKDYMEKYPDSPSGPPNESQTKFDLRNYLTERGMTELGAPPVEPLNPSTFMRGLSPSELEVLGDAFIQHTNPKELFRRTIGTPFEAPKEAQVPPYQEQPPEQPSGFRVLTVTRDQMQAKKVINDLAGQYVAKHYGKLLERVPEARRPEYARDLQWMLTNYDADLAEHFTNYLDRNLKLDTRDIQAMRNEFVRQVNPDAIRGQAKAGEFEPSGENMQYMPDHGYIGDVTDEGGVRGDRFYPGYPGGDIGHEKAGYNGLQWRYNPNTETVYWRNPGPTDVESNAIKDWLSKHGQNVKKEVTLDLAKLGLDKYDKLSNEAHMYNPDNLKFMPDVFNPEEFTSAVDNVINQSRDAGPKDRQPWTVIKADKVKRLWQEFGAHNSISDENALEDIIAQTQENIFKIGVNSYIRDQGYDDLGEDGMDKFFDYIRDEKNVARYSDIWPTLNRLSVRLDHSDTINEKVHALDAIWNTIHGSGTMAHWFLQGGIKTLDEIRDYVPSATHRFGAQYMPDHPPERWTVDEWEKNGKPGSLIIAPNERHIYDTGLYMHRDVQSLLNDKYPDERRVRAVVAPNTLDYEPYSSFGEVTAKDKKALNDIAVEMGLDEARDVSTTNWGRASRIQQARGFQFMPDTNLGVTAPNIITENEVQGTNSRPVSYDEFLKLREAGKNKLASLKTNASPTVGLDKNWDAIKANAFQEAQKPWGGVTIDSHTGEPVTGNIGEGGKIGSGPFALTVKEPGQKTIDIPETASQEEFNAAMDKAKEAFPQLAYENYNLGVFHDNNKGTIDIDPIVVVPTAADAEAIGAYTRAIGGAYDFSTGNGLFPPHVKLEPGGRIGSSGIWDATRVRPELGDIHELADKLGVDPKKNFYEQKPEAQKKIREHFIATGDAKYMPDTEGSDWPALSEEGKTLERNGLRFRRMETDPRNRFISVELLKGDNPVGWITSRRTGNTGNLTWLEVKPEFRRLGYGKALESEILSAWKSIGVKQVNARVITPESMRLQEKLLGNPKSQIITGELGKGGESRVKYNLYMPDTVFDPNFVQNQPAPDEVTKRALAANKAPLVGAHRDLEKGTPVDVRIDIPAFINNGQYVQSVHERGIGKVQGYDSIVRLNGPLNFLVREAGAQKVKEGMAKYPMAVVQGYFNPSRKLPVDINDTQEWTPAGFNPAKHSFFYDKETGTPITGGSEAVMIDNTAYVKDAEFGDQKDFRYMPDTGPIEQAKKELQSKAIQATNSEEKFFGDIWAKALKSTGLQVSPNKPENIRLAAERAVADVRKFARDNPHFGTYYDTDLKTAGDIIGRGMGKELSPDEFNVFRTLNGLFSNQTGLQRNTFESISGTMLFRNNGNLDGFNTFVNPKTGNHKVAPGNPFVVSAQTAPTKIRSLNVFNDLIKSKGGVQPALDFLQEAIPDQEFRDYKQSLGYERPNNTSMEPIKATVRLATGQDENIPRMFAFGKKVGAYTLNNLGDHRYNTVDVWESRFIKSYFRGMLEKNTGIMSSADEHDIMEKFVKNFKEVYEKEIGPSDNSSLQATRWFYIIKSATEGGYQRGLSNDTISKYAENYFQRYGNKIIP